MKKSPQNTPINLSPPINYQRVPIRELRALPIRENPRLHLLDYRLTEAPGMTSGRPRTHGHGAAMIAGGYVLAFCLTHCGEWMLETEIGFPLSRQIEADIYRAVQQKHLAAQARAEHMGTGRN